MFLSKQLIIWDGGVYKILILFYFFLEKHKRMMSYPQFLFMTFQEFAFKV